jgi:hypothetical protein
VDITSTKDKIKLREKPFLVGWLFAIFVPP